MMRVHPLAGLVCAVCLVVAVFIAKSVTALCLIYALVLLAVISTAVVRNHWRFVVFVTLPILLALLLVWGYVVEPANVPATHTSGFSYAVFCWLRIVAVGGTLQVLLLPLVTQPAQLRRFLERTGMGGTVGILIVGSILFLPEVKRRLGIIIDARRAQGHVVSGIKGLWHLPSILMPLVASLLDSASKRAELWSHRGVLHRRIADSADLPYSPSQSAVVLVMALAACAIGLWI